MRNGALIKQIVYTDRGDPIYRYGIVIKVVSRKKAKVFWFAAEVPPYHKKTIGIEIIKLELIEILSDG